MLYRIHGLKVSCGSQAPGRMWAHAGQFSPALLLLLHCLANSSVLPALPVAQTLSLWSCHPALVTLQRCE